jgi:hypothetical protein
VPRADEDWSRAFPQSQDWYSQKDYRTPLWYSQSNYFATPSGLAIQTDEFMHAYRIAQVGLLTAMILALYGRQNVSGLW